MVRAKSAAVKKDATRASAAAAAMTDEGEMNSLLSQYLPGPANNTATQPTGDWRHYRWAKSLLAAQVILTVVTHLSVALSVTLVRPASVGQMPLGGSGDIV